ncbi:MULTISPECIES: glutathione peroxidase [unclassified Pedobacter]|uniref:glutathione peroxidase n=1 Tax=unclassified Pedobacter TaxID=2628915 RepID=UPI001420A253|nr:MULTISPECIES: glutathione peroxidase [unclassified Pedobacter]NII83963.1 glutathione peroxidase [Pedobacter sp. SG908]NMN37837.1 glutathione peroxidase [Pedobacter sp. SG918]
MQERIPNIYSFKVKKINGEEQPLSAYRNKVVLIVNTASACGFTPQLKELQQLKDEINSPDFEILGFPTNDFGKQEPLNGSDISSFCEINHGVKFPVFDKIMVRGPLAHPLYQFLSDKKQNSKLSSKPRWNFHKYIVNKNGELIDYFLPFTKPLSSKIKKKIQQLLNQNSQ